MTSEPGIANDQTFTVQPNKNGISAYGNGSSEKKTQENATFELQKIMKYFNCKTVKKSTISGKKLFKRAKKALKNPLYNPFGLLQELCKDYHWPPSDYEFFINDKCDHPDGYKVEVSCSLGGLRAIGYGDSKQFAKKWADHILYWKMNSLKPKQIASRNFKEHKKPDTVLLNNQSSNNNLSEPKSMMPSDETEKYIKSFVNQLKTSVNPGINELKNSSSPIEFIRAVQLLNQIGVEKGFTTTYIKTNTYNSNPKWLAQMTTVPLMLTMGSGRTFYDAQKSAINGIFLFIKLNK